VRGPRGEVLIPAVASVVTTMDVAHKHIVVDRDALGLDDKGQAEPKSET
jgi:ribosomal 30S subunit maturation factor RimM